MIYIYRPQASTGARLLAERLTELGQPAQKVSRPPTMGDLTICWGAHVPGLVGGSQQYPSLQQARRCAQAARGWGADD
jgi:hypothetical protein